MRTIATPVSMETRAKLRPMLRRLGIPTSNLLWSLVFYYQYRSVLEPGNPGIDEYTASIADTERDLRDELLGDPPETRHTRRSNADRARAEEAVDALIEELLRLYPCPR